GAFAASLTAGTPALPALAMALGNTLWALLAAFLLERAGFRVSLTRLRDAVLLILLAALASTTLSATMGALTLTASGVQPRAAFTALWRDWWLGDAVGVLTLAPVLLTWLGPRTPRLTARQVAETWLLA